MKNPHDVEIKFKTRGDDIERINEAIALALPGNELLAGYLCYIKLNLVEQLNMDLPKEEYPIGHPKGYSHEEFEEYIDKI